MKSKISKKQLVINAIDDIKTKGLKANIFKLSKLSGVARNTLYKWGWPKEELAKIVKEREEVKAKERKKEKQEERSPEEKENSYKQQLMYWHNKFSDSQKEISQLQTNLTKTQDSREFYEKELESERLKNKELHDRVATLTKLLKKLN